MIEAIAEEEIDLQYILLTHGHSDHIGGVKECMETYPEAKLVFSEAEKPMLANAPLDLFGKTQLAGDDIEYRDRRAHV